MLVKSLFGTNGEELDIALLIGLTNGGNCHDIVATEVGNKLCLFFVYYLSTQDRVLTETKLITEEHVNRSLSVDVIFSLAGGVRTVVT